MPKCPHCEAEISHLNFYEAKDHDAEVKLVDGKLVYSNKAVYEDYRGYDCPKCNECICEDDASAIEFLKGGE